jgi:hypothetical protein
VQLKNPEIGWDANQFLARMDELLQMDVDGAPRALADLISVHSGKARDMVSAGPDRS